MNYRLQNADKTSGFTINAHQKCLKFDDKTPKNALKFMQKMRQIFSELSVWRFRPKFYLKKPCVSLFVVGVLSANFAFGANVTHKYILDSQYSVVILQANEQRTDTAISQTGNGQMTTFNCSSSPKGDCNVKTNLSVQGAKNSTYTLQVGDDTTTFYAYMVNIGQNINVNLNRFQTISFDNGVNLGENANFNVTNAGKSINPSYSEYGGFSKIRFEHGSHFILGANSTATFKMATIFSATGAVTLNAGSTLDISVTNATRFESKFTNNGGTLIVRNDYKVGAVYNIGETLNVSTTTYQTKNTTADFINNGGTITIYGDFYNGGKALTDEPFDPPFSGGGNIVLNGGKMTVAGKLVSQTGGDSFGGYQNSAISIYGATLIVGGGLENKQGSTITFGVLNGKMGEFQGALKNEGGVVVVDRMGASLNTPYKIINGSANIDSVNLIGANSQFFTAIYKDGTVTITDGSGGGGSGGSSGSGSGGNVKFNEWQKTLSENEQGIVSVLSSKFGGDSKLLDSQVDIQTALADADKSVKDNLVSQPKNMLAAFKGDVLLAPMSQGRFVARRLAASGAVRFDNGKRVRALQAKPNVEFQLAPVGGVIKSADANGVLAGLSLGANYKMGAFTHKTSLAYAYGTAKQDLSTQSTETKAHLLQAGVLSLYKYGIYETEFNANLLFGSFTIDNKWTERSLNSSSKFNNYELNLGLVAGARYGKKLSFKPFVGVQNYGQRQDGFVGILGFESKAYNAYILDGVLGVQMQYVRSAFSSVYGKVSFERRLYNTHKFVFLRSGENELKYENQSYESVVSAALGAQLLTYKRFKLNAEGFLRHYDTGFNYYGGSLVMRYRF